MKEIMLYFTMIVICIGHLYLWVICSRLARRIRASESRIERDEMHHLSLVYEVKKLERKITESTKEETGK